MPKLSVIANIITNDEHIAFVKAELLKLVPITRAEEGCLQYDLHQSDDNPAHFLFYERWENRERMEQHLNNDHIAAFAKATDGMIEQFWLQDLTPLT